MNNLQKQLVETLEQLDNELSRNEPNDTKLEFLYKKIMILEKHL